MPSFARLTTSLALLTAAVAGARPPATMPASRPTEPMPGAVTLHVGDAAPPIEVEKWLKGTGPTSLADGKVHVVEFWATWCAPCKIAMPHLSDLARKYGDKVSVSSIDVWEGKGASDPNADLIPKVEAFVTRAKDMMAYNVGADGRAGKSAKTWLTAAGLSGIPQAFVVDRTGRIVWTGHPQLGMEQVIDLVLSGKYDKAAADRLAADLQARRTKCMDLYTRVTALMDAGKFAEAVPVNEGMYAAAPVTLVSYAANRYVILTNIDRPAAAKYGEQLLAENGNAPVLLAEVGRAIVDPTSKVAGDRDYGLARRLFTQSFDYLEPDRTLRGLMAEADFRTGDVSDAVALQTEVVKYLQAHDPQNPTVLDDARQKLAEYQKGAAAKKAVKVGTTG